MIILFFQLVSNDAFGAKDGAGAGGEIEFDEVAFSSRLEGAYRLAPDSAESAVTIVVAREQNFVIFAVAYGNGIIGKTLFGREVEYEQQSAALVSKHLIVFVQPF